VGNRRLGGLALALGIALMVPAPAWGDGGLSPEEARRRMKLPEGFQVQVFASEPEIRQPVASCFDERGRLWVIEYLQYPVPAGLKPVTIDQYLRTEYDRVPEPPPRGPKGADRIKILEDTDGDGRADKVTTFIEGLNLASGLAVGYGGVFVAQAPYLLFYPDRDRDDRPDGEPEVRLRGFGLQDAHSTVNSLAWGPDGWLYGAQGSTVTALIRGIGFQQGIWRYHPRTKAFELFAEGGGNTWGLDFDRGGNAFGSSNGGFITFHMVQGGYYWKGFAKHGPLHNPRTYGYFDAIPYAGPKRGGHVTPGGIIYKGDNFPEAFRGAFIGGNLLANDVYWHKIEPDGSSFKGSHAGTLIHSRDPWFRPIDLVTGPDGAVYVVDWYDRRASHLDPRDNWDKTNGRIYKVSYGQPRRVEPFDLSKWSTAELIELRDRPNDWWPDMARRILAERRDPAAIPILKTLLEADRDETTALRDLWALAVSGGLDDDLALALLDHPVAGVRRWTVRLLGDDHRMNPRLHDRLVELAATEPDVTVRSQLASTCQRWKAGDALPIVSRLLARSEDARDPHIPLLLWWAIEKHLRGDREAAVAIVLSPESQAQPLVEGFILERVARALAGGASPAEFEDCARLLAAAPNGRARDRVVTGMEKGLEGHRINRVPAPLAEAIDRTLEEAPDATSRIRLGVRLGSARARERAVARVLDPKSPEGDRLGLIELLGQVPTPTGREALLALLDRQESQALHLAALSALGGHDDPAVADALLAHYPAWNATLRDRLRDVLATRPNGARRLVEAIERGDVPAKDLPPAQVLQIVRLGDTELSRRIEKVWGRVPGPNSEEKRQRIAEIRGMMPEGDKGSAARGHALFLQHCGVCHKLFGEGETIGPELTGSERGNLEFLLSSVVDPSALIRKEYEAQTIALSDGRVLNGLVVEDNESSLTIIDSQRQKTLVPKADIESMQPSAVSVMPEGILDKLPDDQIRDLFRYLQSSGPPAP
jgi:putative membrane-bound dehydrogenase-like protein